MYWEKYCFGIGTEILLLYELLHSEELMLYTFLIPSF